jgi:type I restriction enzyme M protein
MNSSELSSFIWSVADLLRGDYKRADYGKVILPFTLLRRLECVLEPTKAKVLKEYEKRKGEAALEVRLTRASGQAFYNVSPFTLSGLLADQKHVRQNLTAYLGDFSTEARDVFEHFRFLARISELEEKNLLFLLVQKFAAIDLHPDVVPNEMMGQTFEDLIRRFAEDSNETAGEHFTPRDVIRLIVQCLFNEDSEVLTKKGIIRSLYDPTAGTGGMLSVGDNMLHEMNADAVLRLFGQELNDESYAICKGDMLIKGQDPNNVRLGNTLSADAFLDDKFDYGLSNPPFGVDWKKVQEAVKTEYEKKGYGGRFGPGLPRISDGALLFLLHLISKMRPVADGGGRIGIVLNGSPLFTGDAGSGESEIRRWILENDWLETIIALPTDLFYNTGIATYIWILDNDKREDRKGRVQLIDATRMYAKMKKSLGNKRAYLTEAQIAEIVKVYGDGQEGATFTGEYRDSKTNGNGNSESEAPRVVSKVFDNAFFGYRKVTVDRPPRPGTEGKPKKGEKPYDKELRDTETIPLTESIEDYMAREVLPHVPDAWVNTTIRDEKDGQVGKVGYEINFNRYFYVYKPPRPPEVIAAEIREMEKRFLELMKGVVG